MSDEWPASGFDRDGIEDERPGRVCWVGKPGQAMVSKVEELR